MLQILNGDALEMLRTLPDESINCCVTSPPYYGLRDYGTATWEGGSIECDHIEGVSFNNQKSEKFHGCKKDAIEYYKSICAKCGARRVDGQIGLESTPEQYIERLVAVFREVRRVLRNDGTLWLNIGDSYNGSQQTGGGKFDKRERCESTTWGYL